MSLTSGTIRNCLFRFSGKATKFIAAHWGHSFPFWYVCEYPKAGGTWLSKMLAHTLDCSCPQYSLMPIAMPAVIHNHWRYDQRLKNVFYVYRDGRDVMVSYYYHRMREISDEPKAAYQVKLRRRYNRLYGCGFDPKDIRANLPKFIELEMQVPLGSRINWVQHIDQWFGLTRPGITYLTYESLLEDAVATITSCFRALGVYNMDEIVVREAVKRYSFERMTGRSRGSESLADHARKGVAGDWKNHFTREAGEVFHHWAGTTLIALDYESDSAWIDQIEVS